MYEQHPCPNLEEELGRPEENKVNSAVIVLLATIVAIVALGFVAVGEVLR